VTAIVGADGSITVYSASGTKREVGADLLSSTGAYTIGTPTGGRIAGNVALTTGVISGSVSGALSGSFLLQQQAGRITNISTRALAGSGERTVIAGFILRGTGTKPLLVRAVGPTLVNFGVISPLSDPTLSVLSSANGATIASNNDWGNSTPLTTVAAQVGAFPLNANSRDAALQASVSPGTYTALIGGASATPGVALIEIYDTESASSNTARIGNISTRAYVSSSEPLIAGFVIGGDQRKTLLIRAVGPSLAGFGISDGLADPKIDVLVGTTPVASNNDWGQASTLAQINTHTAALNAFPLGAGSRDAALVTQLNPGAYTVQISGPAGTSGTVLVEIYDVDP
jgi:hypothetical protein